MPSFSSASEAGHDGGHPAGGAVLEGGDLQREERAPEQAVRQRSPCAQSPSGSAPSSTNALISPALGRPQRLARACACPGRRPGSRSRSPRAAWAGCGSPARVCDVGQHARPPARTHPAVPDHHRARSRIAAPSSLPPPAASSSAACAVPGAVEMWVGAGQRVQPGAARADRETRAPRAAPPGGSTARAPARDGRARCRPRRRSPGPRRDRRSRRRRARAPPSRRRPRGRPR